MQSRLIDFVCVLVIGLAGVKLRCLLYHFTLFTSPQLLKRYMYCCQISFQIQHYCLSQLICHCSGWYKQWEIIPCFNRAHKAKFNGAALHSAPVQQRVNRNLIGVAAMKDWNTKQNQNSDM